VQTALTEDGYETWQQITPEEAGGPYAVVHKVVAKTFSFYPDELSAREECDRLNSILQSKVTTN
jgi:hypothetical protein